jgi:Raf kinase inhibitor-like YbhB/YbcL family protein
MALTLNSWLVVLCALIAAGLIVACGGDKGPAAVDLTPVPGMTLESYAFAGGGLVPDKYTCEGANVSPPLSWSGTPAETRAFVLLLTDPDAPGKTFDHWVVYDIQADVSGFAEGVSGSSQIQAVAKEGKNDFGDEGYGGPCPPKGSEHHYVFRIYALGQPLGLTGTATRENLQQAMLGKVLASGELVGRFRR